MKRATESGERPKRPTTLDVKEVWIEESVVARQEENDEIIVQDDFTESEERKDKTKLSNGETVQNSENIKIPIFEDVKGTHIKQQI